MNAWVVRGGRDGEGIGEALERARLAVGFRIKPELTEDLTCDDVWDLFRKEKPKKTPGTITKWTNEMWNFRHKVQVGDFVAMPHPHRSGTKGFIAIGRIVGSYEHRRESNPGLMHTRKVEWVNKMVPRSRVSHEFESSIRQRKTVTDISGNIEEISRLLEE